MKTAKEKWRKRNVVRVEYEPDYNDKAWLEGVGDRPTPQTHPDAFYRTEQSAYPTIAQAKRERLKPHVKLSKTQLKKRLHRAGMRGENLKQIADAILRGPTTVEDSFGVVALGWNVAAFIKRFGKRIARYVLRFVKQSLIVMDEAWTLLSSPKVNEFISQGMRHFRKTNAKTLIVAKKQAIGRTLRTKGKENS